MYIYVYMYVSIYIYMHAYTHACESARILMSSVRTLAFWARGLRRRLIHELHVQGAYMDTFWWFAWFYWTQGYQASRGTAKAPKQQVGGLQAATRAAQRCKAGRVRPLSTSMNSDKFWT